MIRFTAMLERFAEQGEKTGWTYVLVPAELAQRLHSSDRKSFRVKGTVDAVPIERLNLLPMGEGDYIMTLKGELRRKLRKVKGDTVTVVIEKDERGPEAPPELLLCFDDAPEAEKTWRSLTPGHRNYFINWINSAKTEPTRVKRIAQSISALERGWNFGEMLRAQKA